MVEKSIINAGKYGIPYNLAKENIQARDTLKDYPIFMAVSKKAGKDNSGDYIYKKDEKGKYIHNANFRKVLDHDLNAIAEAFISFAKKQGFSFYK